MQRQIRCCRAFGTLGCGSSVDVSHVQGTDVVGSLVAFEDGLPRKSRTTAARDREAAGQGRSDDVACIAGRPGAASCGFARSERSGSSFSGKEVA